MGQSNIPVGPPEKHAKAFERLGFTSSRAGKGSHYILTKPGCTATLSIPIHKGKDSRRGLIAGLIKKAGVTEDEYIEAYKGKGPKR